ncbi:hypothetical protein [Clostridium sp.]|uniref:hypothetical protein n=1 Tax=Clostridium sp. TaxID=1506 RepID=UPI002A91E171|nr:hypothetical protein [Clostridium sp.]MDY6012150.1 hypothetical protein [Clostridium sp.]
MDTIIYCIFIFYVNFILPSIIHLREEKLLLLKNRRDILMQDPNFKEEQYGHYLILKRAINREKNYISWLKDELENL